MKMSEKNKTALFESSDSDDDEPKAGTSKSGFTINESYANIYDGFRRKEQLQKLKAVNVFKKGFSTAITLKALDMLNCLERRDKPSPEFLLRLAQWEKTL